MTRISTLLSGLLGASSLLLIDSTIKGTALLALAAVATLLLRRDSAATRHLVWLIAIGAVLAAPALSLLLPQWRALPAWTAAPRPIAAPVMPPSEPTSQPPAGRIADEPVSPPAALAPAETPVEVAANARSGSDASPRTFAHEPPIAPAVSAPAPVAAPASPNASWNWMQILSLVWAAGLCVLLLRLLAARWLLWHSESQATIVGDSTSTAGDAPAHPQKDPLLAALQAAQSRLSIRRPITLLIHPRKTIPVVWGILRVRLLLPESARDWSAEQLQSVLLHELAHVKRHDAAAQLLTQIACAMHWFNPLVWLAAWRLGVERERACDDLVLASGVRPSTYAGHLLDIVSDLSPARWTHACGLAMARRSSLEGRLIAVVSKNLNRRGVSISLASIALAIAAAIAIPIAALRAADEQPGQKPVPASPTAPAAAPATKPADAAKLDKAAEERLKWGKEVNGLRAAVAIRHASAESKPLDQPDLYLAVQNVSDKPIRFSDADVPATINLRTIYLKSEGRILMAMGAREPKWGDHTLQPREIVLLPMFDTSTKLNVPADPTLDKNTIGSHLADGAIKDPKQTFFAKIEIATAPAGAWTGVLTTADTTGADAAGQPQPKSKAGQALYRAWQEHARANGNFPGGLIARLDLKVKEFIRNNTGDPGGGAPFAVKMAPLVGRFDSTHDWTPAEVITLFDDVASAHDIPLETTLEEMGAQTFVKGKPLPENLADAPWGKTQPSGLRLAWLLEPRAAEYRLNTPLKSRILIHNAGKDVVVFRAWTFNQGGHKAHDAQGKEINIMSMEWTTLPRLMPFRLWPGEYAEVNGAGIGVGVFKNPEEWQNTRVGSWIEAKAGDDVTFTPDQVRLANWNEDPAAPGGPRWWLDFIQAQLSRDLPLPNDPEERKRLVYRAGLRIFGTPLTADEIASFVSDRDPNAIESLAKRLAQRAGTTAFTGSLQSGETKFRVLPADPDAAKKPRTATNPGHYTLADNAVLVVSRRPDGERIVNEAEIRFYSADGKQPLPGPPFPLKLPDGYGTWSVAWIRGGKVFWLSDRRHIHRYDFTDPTKVKEAAHDEPEKLKQVPEAIKKALNAALEPEDKAPPAAGPPATERPK